MMRSKISMQMRRSPSGWSIPVLAVLIIPLLVSALMPAASVEPGIVRNYQDLTIPWSSFSGGPMNNFRVDMNLSGLMPIIDWQVPIADDRYGRNAAVIDGSGSIIYASGNHIFKFDSNGSEIWRVELRDVETPDLAPSIPALIR